MNNMFNVEYIWEILKFQYEWNKIPQANATLFTNE